MGCLLTDRWSSVMCLKVTRRIQSFPLSSTGAITLSPNCWHRLQYAALRMWSPHALWARTRQSTPFSCPSRCIRTHSYTHTQWWPTSHKVIKLHGPLMKATNWGLGKKRLAWITIIILTGVKVCVCVCVWRGRYQLLPPAAVKANSHPLCGPAPPLWNGIHQIAANWISDNE